MAETSSGDDRLFPEQPSESQLRDAEGRLAGRASQMTPAHGVNTRREVDLSSRENTAGAELPVAKELSGTLPDPGKQEPAGSESARTETAARNMEQESASSDSLLASGCFASAVSDSQVKEPLSPRQVQSDEKISKEKRGRRQTGHNTRAGSASPHNPSPAGAVAMKPGGSSAGEKSVMPGKQGPTFPDNLRPGPALPFISVPVQISAVDVSQDVLVATPSSSRKVGVEKKVRAPDVSPGIEGSHDVVPGDTEPLKNKAVKGVPIPAGKVFLSEASSSGQRENNFAFKAPQTSSRPATQTSEPRVQIGLLEVVVVSSGQGVRAGRSKEDISSNLAGRFYLRNV